MVRVSIALIFVAAFAGTGALHASTPQSGAATFISDLGEEAIGVLSKEDTGLAAREKKFQKILSQRFDVPTIARFALGLHWRRASSEQKRDYVELFSRYLAKSYATKLGGYKGEKFQVLSEKPLSNKIDVLVNTRIERPSGSPVNVTWRVRNRKNTRRIVDVMVEGISMALTQRNEFAAVVRRYGFQGLLETLRARTTKVSARK